MSHSNIDGFLGMYVTADEITGEDSKHLASNESVVGSEVVLIFDTRPSDATQPDTDISAAQDTARADADDPSARNADQHDVDGPGSPGDVSVEEASGSARTDSCDKPAGDLAPLNAPKAAKSLVGIESRRGYSLGAFGAGISSRIRQAHDSGLICRAFVSAVIYAESAGNFWAEYAVICYPETEKSAWERFCDNASECIAKGNHPDIKLTDKQIAHVLDSDGSWFDLGSMEYAKLPKGAVYFKKRRSAADSMVDKAVSGKKGCKVAATIFWIALALVVIFLVWAYVLH